MSSLATCWPLAPRKSESNAFITHGAITYDEYSASVRDEPTPRFIEQLHQYPPRGTNVLKGWSESALPADQGNRDLGDVTANQQAVSTAVLEGAVAALHARWEPSAQHAFRFLGRVQSLLMEVWPESPNATAAATFDPSDETSSIEIITFKGTLGFCFEPDADQSTWFVVRSDGSSASGFLYSGRRPAALRELLVSLAPR